MTADVTFFTLPASTFLEKNLIFSSLCQDYRDAARKTLPNGLSVTFSRLTPFGPQNHVPGCIV